MHPNPTAELDSREFARQMAALVQVQRVLVSSRATPEELMTLAPDLALRVVSSTGAVFELVDGDELIVRAGTAAVLDSDALSLRLPLAGSLSGDAIRLDRTLRCDDTEADPRVALEACRRFGLRSVIVTVVRDHGGPIGVLKMFDFEPRHFGDAESDCLELLAEALGSAIQRKRAEAETQRTLRIQASIVEMQQRMASSTADRQASMDLVAGLAKELTGADGGSVVLASGRNVVNHAASGTALVTRGAHLTRSGSLTDLAMETGEVLMCTDTELDARVDAAYFRGLGLRSAVVAPLRIDGRVVGALRVGSKHRSAFGPIDVSTLQMLAEQLGAVMQRAAAATERDQAQEALRALNEHLEVKVVLRTAELELTNIALASKEQEIRSVVENMADGVITFSDDGLIRSANAKVEGIFGHAPAALLGRDISLLIPALAARAPDDAGARDIADLIGRIGRETDGRHRSDATLTLDAAISDYAIHGERLWTAIVRDVGERVRIMADLEQARLGAEEASRAKSAFVATMSHEIRTPMNGVIGMIDMLHETGLAPDQSRMLGVARDSANALLAIIEDILDFSKIEAGRVELEHLPLSVAGVVDKVGELLVGVADSKGVALAVEADPRLPEAVWGDAGRLRQVLINLVGNAIKFSAGRKLAKVSVRMSLGTADRDRAHVRIEVEDNGVGMDAATVRRLFAPFSQADASTTRRFGGTGLGLAITLHLVHLMGGDIFVRSTPEVGSTFIVRLPFAVVAPELSAAQRRDELAANTRPLARHVDVGQPDASVLVAEDNEMNQKVIRLQLERLGYRAKIVPNGHEALALWRGGGFDILLTDLHMPLMDGYELTSIIRAEERGLGRIAIIALTANALREETHRCRAAGMDDFLTKPVHVATLDATLRKWLQRDAFQAPAPLPG